jgi:hypothetical protein
MEFFDEKSNWGASIVRVGRAWNQVFKLPFNALEILKEEK